MAKQKVPHKYIYKLHSSRLAACNYDLTLPLQQAIDNHTDIIELSDSQLLRFIDEINGVDTVLKTLELKEEIKRLKTSERTSAINRKIKQLYFTLYETQFQQDYVCIIMDNMKQYDRCNRGFSINGIKYKRFLGTNGGIKASTIIYLSERIYPLIKERLDCGRNQSIPLVPAKLEAYQALICSGSIPVSMPNGIIVVKDCFTKIHSDVIFIDDSETREPKVTEIHGHEIERDVSDGFGFMCPALSRRWSNELNHEPDRYVTAVNARGIPWTKGMLFTFDFHKFAKEVAHNNMIQDVWGDWRDVNDAEVILTESMLKLWNCYTSWEHYWSNVQKYHYQFAVSKVAPYELEEERQTNYQFLQSYDLTDEDINRLIAPTLNTIKSVTGMDYRKAILYLKGTHVDPTSVLWKGAGFAEALMIEPALINDPYVRSAIYDAIKVRIKKAKTGVLDVAGNFAIIGGDLYSLAQSVFGLPVTGILKEGEIYHSFWVDRGVSEVCLFRAPMTSHNNIRKAHVVSPGDSNYAKALYWYKYIDTCVLFNSWDATAEALNGCDFDGDLCFTTNNDVLLRNTRVLPAIFCVQRRAEKTLVTEADIIKSNKLSFGDAIGSTTNVITSQICALAKFDPDSEEYKELSYRVLCGQLYQQNCIDKAKGIISNPMPLWWYRSTPLKPADDDTEEELQRKAYLRSIVVDKKPYFFIYNYDHIYSKYNKYRKRRNASCAREFGMSYEDLLHLPEKTEQQTNFIKYSEYYNPVDEAPCCVNKMCWLIEDSLKDYKMEKPKQGFDPSILKSPAHTYSKQQYYAARSILDAEYKSYQKGLKDLLKKMSDEGIHGSERSSLLSAYSRPFIMKAEIVCSDEVLRCDVMIDLAYKSNASKRFVWEVCGRQIIKNLLERNNYIVSYPTKVVKGDFTYKGEQYAMADYRVLVSQEGDDYNG